MPKRLSSILKVTHKALEQKGVLDTFLDIDSRLHIDPFLLRGCKIPEFKTSADVFKKRFDDVFTLVSTSKNQKDASWKNAFKLLQFKEMGNNGLGYSKTGVGGSAIGPKLAGQILETAQHVVSAGVKDSAVFELIGIFEEGIGADRISDMTIEIIYDNILRYTERVSKELKVVTSVFTIVGKTYNLPKHSIAGAPIVFLPKELLNNLPIAKDWSDIDRVTAYNENLRQRVGDEIGASWKDLFRKGKKEFKKMLLEDPELLKDLIEQYKNKDRKSYDFKNDPLGELIWAELTEEVASKHPVDLNKFGPITEDNILQIVLKICDTFKSLIENNGWFEYLYDNTGKLKPERASQLLFYGVAEAYCLANNLDLSRETNAGVGALDFKMSRGLAKVNVEIKLSTNGNLVNGFTQQLPTYNKAEKTNHSVFLVIKTKDSEAAIKVVEQLVQDAVNKKERVPELFVIDATKQKSASKRKGK